MANYGYFSENGREYIIEKPLTPKRHLVNFSWNSKVISGVNQFGTGEGVFNNQTFLYNDPLGRARMIRDGKRYFYIKDDDSGAYWNTGYYPVKHEPSTLTTIFGTGYSKFIHKTERIISETLCFVANDEPVEIWKINITNLENKERRLRVYPYVEWLLQGYPIGSDYYSYLKTEYYEDLNAIVSYNLSDERPHDRYNGFVASSIKPSGYTGSVREFLGTYGEASRPLSIIEGVCSNEPTCNENLAGSLEIPLILKENEEKELIVLIGNTSDIGETRRIIGKLLDNGAVHDSYNKIMAEKNNMVCHTIISTPDKKINNLVNIWAKNQIALCVEFGRDGVRGFRDTLQDAWAVVPFKPELAKEKIIETLRHQKKDGSALRGWMPINTKYYSDGPTWITPAVTEYIKHTGDADILKIVVPYYDSGEDTILGHMLSGLRHLNKDKGGHELCLAHQGDWNDSLDWMGKEGRGESVMTSMAHYRSLKLFEEMAVELLDDGELAKEMASAADEIKEAVETFAWDGDWYLQGYSDANIKVGSKENQQGKIYLVPQAWAVYSGICSDERAQSCIKSVKERLNSKTGCVMCDPVFTQADKNVGRLTVILPGMYENASTYCHGSAFMIAAYTLRNMGDEAYELYKRVIPDSDYNSSDESGVEPYAFTNQYLGPDNLRAGASISGWITGTAGWMYRNLINHIFGFQPGYKSIIINPCLPSEWKEVAMSTTLRGARYEIKIRRDDSCLKGVSVDGKSIDGKSIPYSSRGKVDVSITI